MLRRRTDGDRELASLQGADVLQGRSARLCPCMHVVKKETQTEAREASSRHHSQLKIGRKRDKLLAQQNVRNDQRRYSVLCLLLCIVGCGSRGLYNPGTGKVPSPNATPQTLWAGAGRRASPERGDTALPGWPARRSNRSRKKGEQTANPLTLEGGPGAERPSTDDDDDNNNDNDNDSNGDNVFRLDVFPSLPSVTLPRGPTRSRDLPTRKIGLATSSPEPWPQRRWAVPCTCGSACDRCARHLSSIKVAACCFSCPRLPAPSTTFLFLLISFPRFPSPPMSACLLLSSENERPSRRGGLSNPKGQYPLGGPCTQHQVQK